MSMYSEFYPGLGHKLDLETSKANLFIIPTLVHKVRRIRGLYIKSQIGYMWKIIKSIIFVEQLWKSFKVAIRICRRPFSAEASPAVKVVESENPGAAASGFSV